MREPTLETPQHTQRMRLEIRRRDVRPVSEEGRAFFDRCHVSLFAVPDALFSR